MMNPIRNIERAPGPGGPERSLGLSKKNPLGGIGGGFDAGRHRPHQYPAQRAPGLRMAKGPSKGLFRPSLFAMQEGGEVDAPDPEDLRSPDDNLSPHDAQLKQLVVGAMAALRGESPDPKRAIQAFIDAFGMDDYLELRQMVLGQHQEPDADDQGGPPDFDEDDLSPSGPSGQGAPPPQPPPQQPPPAPAGMQVGGLLSGPGSGQSDEIEARTPSGRKVLLSDGEYVIDAPTVAALGDGSSSSGARRLDAFREAIRKQAYGHGDQAKPMKRGGRLMLLDALNS